AASKLIRSSAEPILEQYKSVILSSLKFSKLTLGTVAAQFTGQNIGFMRVFRLIFKPLVDEFPYFGVVCYSLMEKKNMDFTLKVVGGELSAILRISDAIEV
ncbi:hypothetical protein HYC85_017399, partial [Camellia sinensis]